MKFFNQIPKLAGAIAVLFCGPFVGVLLAFIFALIAVGQEPGFRGHAVSGDGFLVTLYLAIGLAISIPTSLFGAGWILFGSRREDSQQA